MHPETQNLKFESLKFTTNIYKHNIYFSFICLATIKEKKKKSQRRLRVWNAFVWQCKIEERRECRVNEKRREERERERMESWDGKKKKKERCFCQGGKRVTLIFESYWDAMQRVLCIYTYVCIYVCSCAERIYTYIQCISVSMILRKRRVWWGFKVIECFNRTTVTLLLAIRNLRRKRKLCRLVIPAAIMSRLTQWIYVYV